MGTRNRTITVSEEERERLNQVAKQAFGTDDVAYGATISMLTNNYLSEDN